MSENALLEDLEGLQDLYQRDTDFIISNNESLLNLNGLSFLVSVGSLMVNGNDQLQSIGSLKLKVIRGDLTLEGNHDLINLIGFDSLTHIKGHINISDNNSLASLHGIDNVNPDSILSISVTNNPSLSLCEVQSVCDFISTSMNLVTISNNQYNCNSIAEVDTACVYATVNDKTSVLPVLYPNPANNVLHIKNTDYLKGIRVYDTHGKEIKDLYVQKNQIDISDLSPGMYIVRLWELNSLHTLIFIKTL